MEINRALPSFAETICWKTSCKYKEVNERHFVRCYDKGVPYQKIFNELLNKGYDLKKIDFSNFFTDTKDIPS